MKALGTTLTFVVFLQLITQGALAQISNGVSNVGVATHQRSAERVLGYLPTETGVIFQVWTGGCTRREDFVTTNERHPTTGITLISIARTKADNCLGSYPLGMRFEISYQALGIAPGQGFIITNPHGIIHRSTWNTK